MSTRRAASGASSTTTTAAKRRAASPAKATPAKKPRAAAAKAAEQLASSSKKAPKLSPAKKKAAAAPRAAAASATKKKRQVRGKKGDDDDEDDDDDDDDDDDEEEVEVDVNEEDDNYENGDDDDDDDEDEDFAPGRLKGPGYYKCKVVGCNAKYNQKQTLSEHVMAEHEPTERCPKCKKLIKWKKSMKMHLTDTCEHTGPHEGYQCSEPGCQVVVAHLTTLAAHKKYTHDGVSRPQRVIHEECCNRVFNWSSDYYRHRKAYHPAAGEDAVLYECDKCDKQYDNPGMLKLHKKDHEKNQCPVCRVTYRHYSTLKDHMWKHDKNNGCKNKDCAYFGYRFSSKKTYREHMQVVCPVNGARGSASMVPKGEAKADGDKADAHDADSDEI